MKKTLIFTCLLAALALSTKAQTDTSRQKEEYCMVLATSKFLSKKVDITVDFGQEVKLFSFKDQRLKDDAGKVLAFNSVIDALNYMAKQGWEFVNAYAITINSQNVYNYVLKKRL